MVATDQLRQAAIRWIYFVKSVLSPAVLMIIYGWHSFLPAGVLVAGGGGRLSKHEGPVTIEKKMEFLYV